VTERNTSDAGLTAPQQEGWRIRRGCYGPDRARFLKRKVEGDLVRGRTHYLGNVEFEFENDDLENPRIRRVIAGVAIEIIESDTGIGELRYQHKDHLGSTVALSTAGGQLLTRMHFDPWGQRQDLSGELWNQWATPGQPAWADAMLAVTPRGFTGHEHLDEHGIIHMNGRIYDPHLGRFLQADPFIEDTGTLNRYTYVHNNPLAYTDPSGYIGIKDIVKIAAVAVVSFYTAGLASTALAASNVAGALGYAVAGGAIAGAISTGSIEGALWGAFSGAVFFGIGQAFPGSMEAGQGIFGTAFKNAGELARASLAHGIAGGTISVMQGGRFGHGFLSAGVSKAATPGAMSLSKNEFIQGALVAVVGGTTSEISGGKFANGAATAAMAFAFNQTVSDRQRQKQQAQAKGEELTAPYLSAYDPTSDGYHGYDAGPTLICALSTEGCSVPMMSPIVGNESVPFTLSYAGPGAYDLPYGLGVDPIIHLTPRQGIWWNITEPGHRYHPGAVVHSLYESGGNLWLYTKGVGVGPNATQNVLVGEALFGNMHVNVVNQFHQNRNGFQPPPWVP